MNKTTFNVALEYKLTHKASALSRKYNVSNNAVRYSLNYFKHFYKDNEHIRNQIVLGSILGDGYIQQRKDKYVYRECHSLQEEEYLQWKFLMFDDWTDNHTIYNKNNNNQSSDAKEFATSTNFSSIFKEYKNKSIEQVIEEIDMFGLIIFLLDDGWYSNHSKKGNLLISSGALTNNQLNLIIKKFNSYGIKTKLIGQRNDISINSNYNFIILSYLILLFDNLLNIDVITKKFKDIINDYKNLLS